MNGTNTHPLLLQGKYINCMQTCAKQTRGCQKCLWGEARLPAYHDIERHLWSMQQFLPNNATARGCSVQHMCSASGLLKVAVTCAWWLAWLIHVLWAATALGQPVVHPAGLQVQHSTAQHSAGHICWDNGRASAKQHDCSMALANL